MLFDLKGKLEHLKQEQDEEDFRGEKQDYKFSGLPFRMTRVFMETFRGVFLANLFRFKRLAVRNKEICHAAGVFRVRWATT